MISTRFQFPISFIGQRRREIIDVEHEESSNVSSRPKMRGNSSLSAPKTRRKTSKSTLSIEEDDQLELSSKNILHI